MKTCLHVYTGDGKGKTTAALGLATRFLGHGGRVLFMQFMKGAESGECASLEKLGASVRRLSKDYGFYPHLSDVDSLTEEHNRMLSEAESFSKEASVLLILDESISAYALSLFDCARFLSILQNRKCEIACTGRNAPPEILALSDYATEMRCLYHPYDKGLPARKGIEF